MTEWRNDGTSFFVSPHPKEGFLTIRELDKPDYSYMTEDEPVNKVLLSGNKFFIAEAPKSGYQGVIRMAKGPDHLICLQYEVPYWSKRGYHFEHLLGFAPMVPSTVEDQQQMVPLYRQYNFRTKDHRFRLEREPEPYTIDTSLDGWKEEAERCIKNNHAFNLILRGRDARNFKSTYEIFRTQRQPTPTMAAATSTTVAITLIVVMGIVALAGLATIALILSKAADNDCKATGKQVVDFDDKEEKVIISIDCTK